MIPILYSPTETSFDNNGIGRLVDCISCEVTEKRNGSYEAVIKYPSDGAFFEYLVMSAIVKMQANPTSDPQLFRIYSISKPMEGEVEILLEHISYQLTHIPVAPLSAGSAAEAMLNIPAAAAEDCPFTFYTDMSTTGTMSITEPVSMRSALGGTSGSCLDAFGGELEFDNYTVNLWASRGSNRGVVIRYGKNLIDLKQEEAIDSTITGIYPYYKTDDDYVELTEKVIDSDYADAYPYHRTIPVDLTEKFDAVPTEDELRTAAESYMDSHSIGEPEVSIEVSFIDLADTEEYKDLTRELILLCDTVTIRFDKLGIDATAKVTETVYDTLNERYISINVGSIRNNLSTTIQSITENVEDTVNTGVSRLSSAISAATSLISGNSGGYVLIKADDTTGYPQEILIMDSEDIDTAEKLWRWNLSGLGYSSTGYSGDFGTAITMDGEIVADYITTGVLDAGIITAGILTDDEGNNVWNLDTGEFQLAISSDISTLSDTITNNYSSLSDQINDVSDDISSLGETVDDNSTNITKLWTSVNAIPGQITLEVGAAVSELESTQEGMQEVLTDYASVFAFKPDGFYIGEAGSDTYLKLDSGEIMFWSASQDSWLSRWVEDVFYITDIVASTSLAVGHLKFLPRANGTVDVVFS